MLPCTGAEKHHLYEISRKLANLQKSKSIPHQASGRIPGSEKIQKKIENLESEQAATIREKQALQKKQKTLEIIQQNFSVLLDAPEMQSIEKHESIL